MTPSTTPRLSIKPLTATRSMRFVLALYSVKRTVLASSLASLETTSDGPAAADFACSEFRLVPLAFVAGFVLLAEAALEDDLAVGEATRENLRRTRGESSVSTWRAFKADDARRCVGNGVEMTLFGKKKLVRMICARLLCGYRPKWQNKFFCRVMVVMVGGS
jgi:hypothetical protein